MTRALIKNYLHLPNRLEVIVIAGINNIGAGERADDIIKEMEVFKQVVADHNKKWKHSPLSFTDICIVAVAPKFCSLTVPPNPPEPEIAAWVPPPQFQNKYSEVKKLNSMTIDVNKKDNLADIRLDNYVVKLFKFGTTQHIFDTKPGATCMHDLSKHKFRKKKQKKNNDNKNKNNNHETKQPQNNWVETSS